MAKYIVHNDAIKLLGLTNNLMYLSVIIADLTSQQITELQKAKIPFHLAAEEKVLLLSGDYEKKRSEWKKFHLQGITGAGVKIAVIDTGCNTAYVPCDFTVNYVDGDITANSGHGTQTTSIIKSSIGLAPGCEIHHIKTIDGGLSMSEVNFLNAVNYCIANNIDAVSMSWATSYPSSQTAMDDLAAAGCIAFAATGNSTTLSTIGIPAGLRNCVAINAADVNGNALYKNALVIGATGAVHGVDLAASGVGCETITSAGLIITNFGTSFSCPYAVGVFALFKEQLGISDNKKVLQYMYNKAMKQADTQLFGKGFLTA